MRDGYIRVHRPEHPKARNGYIFEHILVAEAALGHFLPQKAELHHRNGDHADNRPANLLICHNHSYHMLLHWRVRAYRATGDPTLRRCAYCHAWTRMDREAVVSHAPGRIAHRECRNAYKRRWRQELRA